MEDRGIWIEHRHSRFEDSIMSHQHLMNVFLFILCRKSRYFEDFLKNNTPNVPFGQHIRISKNIWKYLTILGLVWQLKTILVYIWQYHTYLSKCNKTILENSDIIYRIYQYYSILKLFYYTSCVLTSKS